MKKYIVFFILFLIAMQSNAIHLDWAKMLKGDENSVNDMKIDNAGNTYTCGYFLNTVDFDPGPATFNLTSFGSYDTYLIKLDKDGNFIWAKQFGGVGVEEYSHLVLDAQENVYLISDFQGTADVNPDAGVFNVISAGTADVFISKLDHNGNFIWAKQFGDAGGNFCSKIQVDNTNNIIFGLTFTSILDADPNAGIYNLTATGVQDAVIIKLNSSGNLKFAKQLSGMGSNLMYVADFAVDDSNNIIYCGRYPGTVDFDPGVAVFNLHVDSNNYGLFVSKLDSNGNFMWAKSYECDWESSCNSMEIDEAGNIIVGGFFRMSMSVDMGPTTIVLNTPCDHDIFILKLNPAGNSLWVKQIGSTPGKESLGDLVIDKAGSIYYTGWFYTDSADMDPGAGNAFIYTAASPDIVIAKIDALGNYVWARQLECSDVSVGYSIEMDAQENLHVCGVFQGTIDFDPNAAVYNLSDTTLGSCIVKFMNAPLSVNHTVLEEKILILYPNPSNKGIFYLKNDSKALWNVYDSRGNFVLNGWGNTIDISRFSKGNYIIQLSVGDEIYYSKVLSQ